MSALSRNEVVARLAAIVNEVAGVPVNEEQLEKLATLSFADDLDIDSLSMVEVVVAAEQEFDISIPDAAVNDLKTVGDAAAYITKLISEKPK
ncbi:acyl carrier protein [Streptomyces sp. NPDC055085]